MAGLCVVVEQVGTVVVALKEHGSFVVEGAGGSPGMVVVVHIRKVDYTSGLVDHNSDWVEV